MKETTPPQNTRKLAESYSTATPEFIPKNATKTEAE